MSNTSAIAAAALVLASASPAEAGSPIRIGASLSQTGVYAALGQNQLRGYRLCVKHVNDKGGVLGGTLDLVVHDDGSDPATAIRLYERLITQEKVALVLGPYGSPISEAVADVAEKYRMPMIAPVAATTSIYRQGRRFVFGMLPAAEVYLEGLIDMAAKRGLKTVAVINVDELFANTAARATVELATRKGLRSVVVGTYPLGHRDFSPILRKIRAADPDVVAGATRFEDAVEITRQMKALDVNPRMYGLTVGVDTLQFRDVLGRDAEFVYGVTPWIPELVELRAGGLVPIAREYPGASAFVAAHRKEFPGADMSYHTASGYGGCQVLVEAVRRAGSLDGEKIRDAILELRHNTVFGAFRVDKDGFQVAHRMVMFQWQDGKKVIVWPEDLAADRAWFPTPPWSQR